MKKHIGRDWPTEIYMNLGREREIETETETRERDRGRGRE